MVGISNIYITTVLDQCKKLSYWNGIYSSNNIPNHILNGQQDFAIIVNLARQNEKGTHFVTIIQAQKKMFLFDSLTTPRYMLPNNIKQWMDTKNGVNVLSTPIQNFNSEFCGFYCIYFILWLSLPNSSKVLNRFSVTKFNYKNLKQNDAICIKMIIKMLKYQK